MMVDEAMRVRDRRKKGWFWMDNSVLDDFGATLGVHAIAVYAVLCRHASNDDGSCVISMNTIAKKIGCSRAQVKRELRKLEDMKMIEIVPRYSGTSQQASEYYVMDTPGGIHPDPGSHRPGVTGYPPVVSDRPGGGVTQSHLNKDSIDKDLKIKTGPSFSIREMNEGMEALRAQPLQPSVAVDLGQFDSDLYGALSTHPMFRMEVDDLEGSRKRWQAK